MQCMDNLHCTWGKWATILWHYPAFFPPCVPCFHVSIPPAEAYSFTTDGNYILYIIYYMGSLTCTQMWVCAVHIKGCGFWVDQQGPGSLVFKEFKIQEEPTKLWPALTKGGRSQSLGLICATAVLVKKWETITLSSAWLPYLHQLTRTILSCKICLAQILSNWTSFLLTF